MFFFNELYGYLTPCKIGRLVDNSFYIKAQKREKYVSNHNSLKLKQNGERWRGVKETKAFCHWECAVWMSFSSDEAVIWPAGYIHLFCNIVNTGKLDWKSGTWGVPELQQPGFFSLLVECLKQKPLGPLFDPSVGGERRHISLYSSTAVFLWRTLMT